MVPTENSFRTVHAVCAYWLTSSDGSNARTGAGRSKRLTVLNVTSSSADFIRDLVPLQQSRILHQDQTLGTFQLLLQIVDRRTKIKITLGATLSAVLSSI